MHKQNIPHKQYLRPKPIGTKLSDVAERLEQLREEEEELKQKINNAENEAEAIVVYKQLVYNIEEQHRWLAYENTLLRRKQGQTSEQIYDAAVQEAPEHRDDLTDDEMSE